MADGTKIEWTDATWNPIRARNRETGGVGHYCVHVSEGCRNCYAERMQPRFRNPIRYAAQDREKVNLFLDRKTLEQPLRWREPRMVFVCSMTDLFLEDHPDEWIDAVFAVMALCPQHTFQVLTKRPERMREYMASIDNGDGARLEGLRNALIEYMAQKIYYQRTGEDPLMWLAVNLPLPNVWLGVSTENQAAANRRIPPLLDTPALVRFVSAEPLLGPADLTFYMSEFETDNNGPTYPGLDWIIVGGESGPGARPMHPDWARSFRDQCQGAGVPFFFKQWGEWVDYRQIGSTGWEQETYRDDGRALIRGSLFHRGRPMFDGRSWPTKPMDKGVLLVRAGKRRAGRHLDGRVWDERPG